MRFFLSFRSEKIWQTNKTVRYVCRLCAKKEKQNKPVHEIWCRRLCENGCKNEKNTWKTISQLCDNRSRNDMTKGKKNETMKRNWTDQEKTGSIEMSHRKRSRGIIYVWIHKERIENQSIVCIIIQLSNEYRQAFRSNRIPNAKSERKKKKLEQNVIYRMNRINFQSKDLYSSISLFLNFAIRLHCFWLLSNFSALLRSRQFRISLQSFGAHSVLFPFVSCLIVMV